MEGERELGKRGVERGREEGEGEVKGNRKCMSMLTTVKW